MTDIVDRLCFHNDERLYQEADVLMSEAAEEIKRLRAELARPAQRPLSEEQIHECFESVMFDHDVEPTRVRIARAIERAHGIEAKE